MSKIFFFLIAGVLSLSLTGCNKDCDECNDCHSPCVHCASVARAVGNCESVPAPAPMAATETPPIKKVQPEAPKPAVVPAPVVVAPQPVVRQPEVVYYRPAPQIQPVYGRSRKGHTGEIESE